MLLRRDATHLQVGTNPGVVIRDRPGLYPLLLALDGTRDLESLRRHARRNIPELDLEVDEALSPLIAGGLVVDTPARVKPALRIEIAHDAPTAALARHLTNLLTEAGVAVGPDPDLLAVLSTGEPDRTALAEAVRYRITHLVVVLDEESVRIGPLVVPGQTPCIGCADLHRASWDPAWPALVPQFGRTVRPRPLDSVTLTQHAAAVEVAATCLGVGDPGSRPNQIRTLGPDRRIRVTGQAAFHPRCACALLSAA